MGGSAYFATTVSYKCKMFIKSTTGFKIINVLYLIADAVTRKARASFLSHFKDQSNLDGTLFSVSLLSNLKDLQGTNGLAYFAAGKVTNKKGFITTVTECQMGTVFELVRTF